MKQVFILLAVLFSIHVRAEVASPSIAFYYSQPLPLAEMSLYKRVVVQPAHTTADELEWFHQRQIHVYSYLSVGESSSELDKGLLANRDWNSQVMDLTSAAWQKRLLDEAKQLKQRGFTGLFLDTLDSYHRLPAEKQAEQKKALIHIVSELSTIFNHDLILNRGFDVLPQLAGKATHVVAEGLYTKYDPQADSYEVTPYSDQKWLTGQLEQAKKLGFQVEVIDYAPFKQRRKIADKIMSSGYLPWVTDGQLETWGTSDLTPVPRKIIIPFNSDKQFLIDTNVHKKLATLIEYLGYLPDYIDLSKQGLPKIDLSLYAGIVSWSDFPDLYTDDYINWLIDAKAQLPLLVLGELPSSAKLFNAFGLKSLANTPNGPFVADRFVSWLKGERATNLTNIIPYPLVMADGSNSQNLISIKAQNGLSLIQGVRSNDDILITAPWEVESMPEGDSAWLIDPYKLLTEGLKLPAIPAPDVTTESGRRRLMLHIDGDAFPSLARLPGQPFAAKAMQDNIIEHYKLPITVSVIQGEIAPDGLFPKLSHRLETIARDIYSLPYVDMASHSFSHPFFWRQLAGREKVAAKDAEYGYHLNIPGYDKIDLKKEIDGSINYMNSRLAPKNKRVKLMFWSGDAAPGPEALRRAKNMGVLNVNGGNTITTNDNPTLSTVWPIARPEEELLYQVYAPTINENVFTNEWHGPFNGFSRLVETLRITGKPYRLKPFAIYFHFYSATNPAGLKALHTVIDYALAHPHTAVQLAHYAKSAKGFYFSALAKNNKGEWVFKGQNIPTLRIPMRLGKVDLNHSKEVAGMTEDDSYVHLPKYEAVLAVESRTVPVRKPYLASGNIILQQWDKNKVRFRSWEKAQLVMKNAKQCRFQSDNGEVYSGMTHGTETTFELAKGIFTGSFKCSDGRQL